jgi:endonuclease YncB( thermonuclease family)
VIKQSKIRRHNVELRPSRIRRDPVREEKKVEARSHEREIWLGVVGVVLFGIAIAVSTVGFSVITGRDGAGAAQVSTDRFGDCEGGPNCVIDGDTIRIAGETVTIAGMEAPRVQNARCQEETERGTRAVQQLTDLLNSGKVTTAGEVHEADGRLRTKVLVDGRDVGAALIAAGDARESGSDPDWCS